MMIYEHNNDVIHFLFIQHYTLQFSIFYSCKVPLFLTDFNQTLISWQIFEKYAQNLIVTQEPNCSMQTDRHDMT